ncbi:MAG: F0F1 ATP synthase subunit B [Verrucomicrobiales bacterium]|nr:F0F1 ATP synthase subunit B [Verrucomicrobiales bacterium]
MDVLTKFGVNWPAFIAQVLIVLVVYTVLKKYAFGPVLAMLEQRRSRIEEGEKELVKIREQLEQADYRVKAMLDEANAKAERLIGEARESASALREQKTQEAISEAEKIVAKAKEASKLEHERLLGELKRDFGRLVVETTGKVTGKVLDEKDQSRINQEAVGQLAI